QANCWPKANGRYECTCLGQPLDEFHDVEAGSPTAACAVSSAYCLEGPQATDAVETCTIDRSSSEEDSCRVWELCAVPVTSLDGATAYAHSSRSAGCDPMENEKSICHCYGNERTFSFEVPTPEASCEAARLACTPHSEVLPTGDVSCQATSQSTSTGSCSVDLDCLQPASVDGRLIAAQGRLTVHCSQPTPSDPWRCSCGSAETFAVFEYGAPE